jgi:hypothetical protein
MKYASVCSVSFVLACSLSTSDCLCSFTICRRSTRNFPFFPTRALHRKAKRKILMANIGMTTTIIYNGKIIFLSSEHNKSRHKTEIYIKRLCWKIMVHLAWVVNSWSWSGSYSCSRYSSPQDLPCIFMSTVPFTYCIHTCQERINNPRKFISLNRQRASERIFTVTVQIKRKTLPPSSPRFISVPWSSIHVWLAFLALAQRHRPTDYCDDSMVAV